MAKVEQAVQIELLGIQAEEHFLKINPVLSPGELGGIVPEYKNFEPLWAGSRLWVKRERLDNLEKEIRKASKIMLLISGPAAAGKHELVKELQKLLPGKLYWLVTATTRARRDYEKEGIDHFFYRDSKELLQEVVQGKFVEKVREGEFWYGIPKKSFDLALKQHKPIIVSDAEISSGWPKIEEYLASLPQGVRPQLVKIFLLPELAAKDYFGLWLPEKRPSDYQTRGIRAGWEMEEAPKHTDFFLANPLKMGIGTIQGEIKKLASLIS